jgi:hypothetical protein
MEEMSVIGRRNDCVSECLHLRLPMLHRNSGIACRPFSREESRAGLLHFPCKCSGRCSAT